MQDPQNRGLFALRDFKKGDDITEYCGPVLSREEAETLQAAGQNKFCRGLSRHEVIDGISNPSEGEGCAQIVNDGTQSNRNNCTLENFLDPPEKLLMRCVLRASRDISAGEELFTSYGYGYWRSSKRL